LIFLSYSQHDANHFLADHIVDFTIPQINGQVETYRIWRDRDAIVPGQAWADAIQGALRQCDVVVAVLPTAFSEEVANEIRMAMELHKPIVPATFRVSNLQGLLAAYGIGHLHALVMQDVNGPGIFKFRDELARSLSNSAP
jgi:hypothetical protein